MIFTRADQREALQHVLHEVLVLEDNDPIPSAFAHHGITTITDLINFPPDDIHTLTYPSEDGFVNLHRGNVGLLKAFQAFFLNSSKHSPFHSLQQFLDLNQDDFDAFRLSPSYYAPLLGSTRPSSSSLSKENDTNLTFLPPNRIRGTPSSITDFSPEPISSLTTLKPASVGKSTITLFGNAPTKSTVSAVKSDDTLVCNESIKTQSASKSVSTPSVMLLNSQANGMSHDTLFGSVPSNDITSVLPAYPSTYGLCPQLLSDSFFTVTEMYFKYYPPSIIMSLILPLAFLLRFGVNYLPGIAFFVILLHFKGGLSSSFILSFLPILLVHADGEAYLKGTEFN